MYSIRILPLFAFLLLFGCRKNEIINETIIEENPPKVLVVSTYKGKVTDENDQPVAGARVTVLNNVTTTNALGLFEFINVKAPKTAALITAEKNGYYIGSVMSGSVSASRQYTRITLMKRENEQSLDALTGGTLSWPTGLKITIPPNSLRRITGSPYAGEVKVAARWLDPTDPNLGAIMPGALMAHDESGNEKVLDTYGMVALDLREPGGSELHMKEGETVQVAFPIPDELAATAPQEIDLWNFDLEAERWLVQGVCQKSGSTYIGSVGGNGYWNCDVALEPICLSGTFLQSDSTPAFYVKVIVEDQTTNFIYWGYTDINGFFCGAVPKDAPLKITLKDLCDNVLYEANIGPFSMDTDLGDIFLTQTLQQYMIHITGQLQDCNGVPVTDGQIAVQYPGELRLFALTSPGVFDINLALNCIDFPELQITGYDLINFKSTPVQFHSDNSDISLGTLTACENPADYFTVDVNGTMYKAAPTRFYLKNNVTTNWMVLEAVTLGGRIGIDLKQYNGPGTYTDDAFFIMTDNPETPAYLVLGSVSPDITVNITADDGQMIIGNISGTAYNPLMAPFPISGLFKIKKEI